MAKKNIVLRAIAMVRPSKEFINAPSKNRPNQMVSEDELKKDYIKGTSLVSFDEDGVSNPQEVVRWEHKGLGGRYIVDSELPAGYRKD